MRTVEHSSSWFVQLRRERGLFALVGALLLVLNLMQPLAVAGQMQQGVWPICEGNVVDAGIDGDTGTPLGKCQVCISGLCASASAPQKALQPSGIAFSAPVVEAALAWSDRNRPVCSSRAGRSQAIRAPPFSI